MERKELFYTEIITDSIEPAKKALYKAIELARECGSNEVLICVPQRGTIQGFEGELFEEKMSDSLINKGTYSDSGVNYFVTTNQSVTSQFVRGPLLGLEVKIPELTKYGNDLRVTSVVYLPRIDDEINHISREEFEKIEI